MKTNETIKWQTALGNAIGMFLEQNNMCEGDSVAGTPRRVVAAYAEMISGAAEDPGDVLSTSFEDTVGYDGMVQVHNIPIVTTCEHHLLPIVGMADFAYISNGRVVGLSKIPRFINILCRRLQLQERLTVEIAEVFEQKVSCRGCAITIRAYHCCMLVRGVRVREAYTETRVLRGAFEHDPSTRQEYLAGLSQGVTFA